MKKTIWLLLQIIWHMLLKSKDVRRATGLLHARTILYCLMVH